MRTAAEAMILSILISAMALAEPRTMERFRPAPLPTEVLRQQERVSRLLPAETKVRVSLAVREFAGDPALAAADADAAKLAEGAVRTQLGSLGSMDVTALVFLVMAEASRGAEEDMRAALAELEKFNQAKQSLREQLARLREQYRNLPATRAEPTPLIPVRKLPPGLVPLVAREQPKPILMAQAPNSGLMYPVVPSVQMGDAKTIAAAELPAEIRGTERQLDSLGELSDELSLKLQILMDRRSKLISTLSNILKKIAQTQDEVIQNIK